MLYQEFCCTVYIWDSQSMVYDDTVCNARLTYTIHRYIHHEAVWSQCGLGHLWWGFSSISDLSGMAEEQSPQPRPSPPVTGARGCSTHKQWGGGRHSVLFILYMLTYSSHTTMQKLCKRYLVHCLLICICKINTCTFLCSIYKICKMAIKQLYVIKRDGT